MAPVATLTELIAFLDDLLEPERFDDYGPNGLQVPGARGRRTTVVTGVSAGRELFERAIDAGAELVLVHHGLFWDGPPARARPRRRSAACSCCSTHDIALAAYHLPLDAHLELGNNALLAARARLPSARAVRRPRAARRSASPRTLRRRRHRRRPSSSRACARPSAAASRWRSLDGPEPRAHDRHRLRRRRRPTSRDAIAAGLDAFLTGEPAERVMRAGARGRRSTSSPPATTRRRRSACAALGELLAARFGVAHVFVDVPNPI